jgi:hypothetical protein
MESILFLWLLQYFLTKWTRALLLREHILTQCDRISSSVFDPQKLHNYESFRFRKVSDFCVFLETFYTFNLKLRFFSTRSSDIKCVWNMWMCKLWFTKDLLRSKWSPGLARSPFIKKKTGNSVYHGSKEHIFWVHGLKYKILGFFHLHYEISVRQSQSCSMLEI